MICWQLINRVKNFLICIKRFHKKIIIIIIINIYIQLHTVNTVKNHIYKVICIGLYMDRGLITNRYFLLV